MSTTTPPPDRLPAAPHHDPREQPAVDVRGRGRSRAVLRPAPRRPRREQPRVPPGRADGQPRAPAAGGRDHRRLDGAVVVSHRYALAYNQRHGRINHLLGRRFHSSEVPDTHAARAVCVYIALNPIRAGLCAHPRRLGVRLLPQPRGRRDAAPHLQPDFTRQLFAARGTTFAAATEAALARERGGRADTRRDPTARAICSRRRTSSTPASSTATPCPRSPRTTGARHARSPCWLASRGPS